MSSALFFPPFVPILGPRGLPAGAAKAYFYYTDTTTLAPIYGDVSLAGHLENPVETDALGLLPSIYLDTAITYRYRVVDILGAELVDIDPYVPGVFYGLSTPGTPGTNGINGGVGSSAGEASLFSAASGMTIGAGIKAFPMAGHSTPAIGPATYVVGADVNSAFVAANPLWSFLDASGQGWRLHPMGQRLSIDQFGGDPITSRASSSGAKTTAAAANIAAWKAMRECALYYRTNAVDISFNPTTSRTAIQFCGTAPIGLGIGTYWLGGNSLLLTEGTFDIGGQGSGNIGASGYATVIEYDGTCDGMVVHNYNTYSGPEKLSTAGYASGTVIHDIVFDGGAGALDMANPRIGVWSRTTDVIVRSCGFVDWASCGMVFGNRPGLSDVAPADNCRFDFCWGVNIGYAGAFLDGSDSSAGGSLACSFIYCGYYGIYDSSFLANRHVNHHARGIAHGGRAGTTTNTIGTRVIVSHNAYYWHVSWGQHVAASTTEPGTDPTIWVPMEAAGGSPDLTYAPAWVSGTTYASGGAFVSDNVNAPTDFDGCYVEDDSPGIYNFGGIIQGGQHVPQVFRDQADLVVRSGELVNRAGGIGIAETYFDAAVSSGGVASRSVTALLGGEYGNGTVLYILDNVNWPTTLRQKIDPTSGDFHLLQHGNNAATTAIVFTKPATALNFGRNSPVPFATVIQNLMIGNGNGARRHDTAAAAPTTGMFAQGEIIYNNAPTAGGKAAWICTTGGLVATVAWAATHAYVVGDVRTNDSGKSYLCITAGTSAGSGGPTGTGANITDGTAHWDYHAAFVFKAFGAIDA